MYVGAAEKRASRHEHLRPVRAIARGATRGVSKGETERVRGVARRRRGGRSERLRLISRSAARGIEFQSS